MPDWYHVDEAVPAEGLAKRAVRAVERDEPTVYHPPILRLLRIVYGLSPRAGDAVLRRLRGTGAAPRR